jgi:hypothetical protein
LNGCARLVLPPRGRPRISPGAAPQILGAVAALTGRCMIVGRRPLRQHFR